MNSGRLVEEIGKSILPLSSELKTLPRQVVTLAFLSSRIPAALITEQLARCLCLEAKDSVVLVRLNPQDEQHRFANEPRAELFLNGEFHMPPQLRRTEGGFHAISLGFLQD